MVNRDRYLATNVKKKCIALLAGWITMSNVTLCEFLVTKKIKVIFRPKKGEIIGSAVILFIILI